MSSSAADEFACFCLTSFTLTCFTSLVLLVTRCPRFPRRLSCCFRPSRGGSRRGRRLCRRNGADSYARWQTRTHTLIYK